MSFTLGEEEGMWTRDLVVFFCEKKIAKENETIGLAIGYSLVKKKFYEILTIHRWWVIKKNVS